MRHDPHEVFNQSPPYLDVDLFGSDLPLQTAVAANGAVGEAAALSAFGRRWVRSMPSIWRGSPTRASRD